MEPSALFLVTVPGIPRELKKTDPPAESFDETSPEDEDDDDEASSSESPAETQSLPHSPHEPAGPNEGVTTTEPMRRTSSGPTTTPASPQPATPGSQVSQPQPQPQPQSLSLAPTMPVPPSPTSSPSPNTTDPSAGGSTAAPPTSSTLSSIFMPPPGCAVTNGVPTPPSTPTPSPPPPPPPTTTTAAEEELIPSPNTQQAPTQKTLVAANPPVEVTESPPTVLQPTNSAPLLKQSVSDSCIVDVRPGDEQESVSGTSNPTESAMFPMATMPIDQSQVAGHNLPQEQHGDEGGVASTPQVSFQLNTGVDSSSTGLRQRTSLASSNSRSKLTKQPSERAKSPAQVVSDFIKASSIPGASRITLQNASWSRIGGALGAGGGILGTLSEDKEGVGGFGGGSLGGDPTAEKSLFMFRVHRNDAEKYYARLVTLGITRVGTIFVTPLSMAGGLGVRTIGSKREGETEKDKFADTIKARIAVTELTEVVEKSAVFTFDYVALVLVASSLALLGLAVNSTVVIVASMLVSPLMGPILAVTFGVVVADYDLAKIGLRSELYGLFMCVVVGFFGGLIAAPLCVDEYKWPTEEMSSRGEWTGLIVGIMIAIPSGVGVALSVLGNNTSSLVGVAISASLLPPAVNAGLLIAFAALTDVIGNDPSVKVHTPGDLTVMAVYSLVLCLLNILIVWVAGIATFRLKEVTRLPGEESAFFSKEVKAARHFNTVAKNSPEGLAMRQGLEQYLRLHGIGKGGVGGSLDDVRAGRSRGLGHGSLGATTPGLVPGSDANDRVSIANRLFFQEPQAGELGPSS